MSTSKASFQALHFWWAFLRWNIGKYDPSWVIDSIINELAAIPTLRDINLNYLRYASHFGNLDAFSNLHKIRVQGASLGIDKFILDLGKLLAQCPGLTDLDISIESFYESDSNNMSQLFRFLDQTEKPLSLHNLRMDGISVSPDFSELAIGNLRSLQSFHIYRFSSNGTGYTIWDIFRKERIYIKSLSTDAADDSLLRYLSSFHGMRKFSLIKYSFLQFDISLQVLQNMIPHHVESLTELSMLAGPNCRIINLFWSENLVNLLSSFKNLQYFGLQLHVTACYISIIVGVFCNVYILFITLTRSQGSIIQTCSKIFPKLQRLVLNTPWMAWAPQNTTPTTIVHDAITQYQYQLNDHSGPVTSFEIECEGRVYFPRHDETTGTFSYII